MRTVVASLGLLLAGCRDGANGDRLAVVGSSTVYPFTAMVAERYVDARPRGALPVIEATGTGAGFRLLCSEAGTRRPDLVDASRRITVAERAACERQGVAPLIELPIGSDGIVLAQAIGAPPLSLSAATLYRAVAAAPSGRPNAARTWRDVDPQLPATPIVVYGPPASSGTRDAFATLFLARGCHKAPSAAPPPARCTRIRDDDAYRDAGESDNLTVQKLVANPGAIGIFGYAYLRENADRVRAIPVDGVTPTERTIADGHYPGARTLYLYASRAQVRSDPALGGFLQLYLRSTGPDGPLVRQGLIPLPATERLDAEAVLARTQADPVGGAS